jgi:hypothetical protein
MIVWDTWSTGNAYILKHTDSRGAVASSSAWSPAR